MELSYFKKCRIDPTRKSYFAGNHTKGLEIYSRDMTSLSGNLFCFVTQQSAFM